jgi:hypothetical protein
MTDTRYRLTVTADCCGYRGTIAAVELHDCAIAENGGRCEDYPACGHTDGDGCQTLPEHTSAYYLDNPHLLDDDYPVWDEGDDDRRDFEEEEYNRHLLRDPDW